MTFLQMVLLGMKVADAAADGFALAQEVRGEIETMIAEGREPTGEEWAKINAVADHYRARIQAAADKAAEA